MRIYTLSSMKEEVVGVQQHFSALEISALLYKSIMVNQESRLPDTPPQETCLRLGQTLQHLLKPPDMYANILCKFRMEASPHDIPLPDSNNIVELPSLDFS